MALEPGATLGQYEISAKIGEGGMGEVYQARDTKLDRDVALKVLPEAFTQDPDRLARFEREAKVLASLNHPNIGGIHGLEDSGDVRALVLELVEGPTLADRIAKGPIPVDEALPIARQIADALEAAHEQGIIHRDLKPANIKVRDDGTVKVLDFGLAKAFEPDSANAAAGASMSPTISLTAAATQMGMIIGTAAYMSPEQARGRPVDKRADIWAFGVVLYEMLTGARPFQGEDVSLTLASVMKSDVSVATLPPNVPPAVRAALTRCLEKDPKQRLRDIGDVRLAMEGAFETSLSGAAEPAAAPQLSLWQRPVPLAAGVLALLVAASLAVWGLTRPAPPAPPPLARFVLQTPPGADVTVSLNPEVAISPDGTRVVYTAGQGVRQGRTQLYLRQIGELEATPIRGTEGGFSPFFSPDGESIGFKVSNGLLLRRVSVLGGPATTIVASEGTQAGIHWGPDGAVVFGTLDGGLMRVPAVGGEAEPLTTVDPEQGAMSHRHPFVLPNLKGILFTAWSDAREGSQIALLDLATGLVSDLLPEASHPHYSPTGHIVYGARGTLWAVGFDAERLELTTSNPVPVVEDVSTNTSGIANVALAANGSLVYVTGSGELGGSRSLVWVDRDGEEEPIATPPRQYGTVSVSPDGARAAVGLTDEAGNPDVWVAELARGTLAPLTTEPGFDGNPLWHPDGRRIVFESDRDGSRALFIQAADGTGTAEPVLTIDDAVTSLVPWGWLPDGATLLVSAARPDTGRDVGMVSIDEPGSWEPLLESAASEGQPAVSPDGRWLSYSSTESGVREVYIRRFPGLEDRRPISVGGGFTARWSSDSRELTYQRSPGGPPDAMMRVPIDVDSGSPPSLVVGTPELLFEWRYFSQAGGIQYSDVTPDGQRFLMIANRTDGEGTSNQLVLIQNWFEELRRLVPVP